MVGGTAADSQPRAARQHFFSTAGSSGRFLQVHAGRQDVHLHCHYIALPRLVYQSQYYKIEVEKSPTAPPPRQSSYLQA